MVKLSFIGTSIILLILAARHSVCIKNEEINRNRIWDLRSKKPSPDVSKNNMYSPLTTTEKNTKPDFLKSVHIASSIPMDVQVIDDNTDYITVHISLRNYMMLECIDKLNIFSDEMVGIEFSASTLKRIKGLHLTLLPINTDVEVEKILFSPEENIIGMLIPMNSIIKYFTFALKNMFNNNACMTFDDLKCTVKPEHRRITIQLRKEYFIPTFDMAKDTTTIINQHVRYPDSLMVEYSIEKHDPIQNVLYKNNICVKKLIPDFMSTSLFNYSQQNEMPKIKYIDIDTANLQSILFSKMVEAFMDRKLINTVLLKKFKSKSANKNLCSDKPTYSFNKNGAIINSESVFVTKTNLEKNMYNLGLGDIIPSKYLETPNKMHIKEMAPEFSNQYGEITIAHIFDEKCKYDANNIESLEILMFALQSLIIEVSQLPLDKKTYRDITNIQQVIEPGIAYAIKNRENHKILSSSIYYYVVQVLYGTHKLKINYEKILGYLAYIDAHSPFIKKNASKQDLEKIIIASPALCNNFKKVILGCSCGEQVYEHSRCTVSKIPHNSIVVWNTNTECAQADRVQVIGCACIEELLKSHCNDNDCFIDKFTGECPVDEKGNVNKNIGSKNSGKNKSKKSAGVFVKKAKADDSSSFSSGTKTVISMVAIAFAIISICSSVYYIFFV
ncbi:hypothetical protein NEPAR06_0058 [Nematocida parisii]|uniref:uncharacterized protein n=1 Tax=Nematocida parisii (strain ERTm1 / ATCC PRA-289) TaxID=881290 RepID=UPI000264B5DF|nr:uncharacterized protein NEPG_00074 [Nematocida parisii ERTm1]EIJ94552.1 hypothetical protein NEPG_00074 [Nematocida parisii ERTm1]KAI5152937.1 hypothetical protein NEPAR06_0058 [Nematocida parisii]KAI5157460.1 hypothetical protein NEPAR05_1299 [Nematocida parisii]|eukprot:XP_013057908.1 hypothetical protein NEPG_00074 [Nematocida parisii ERTm1]